MLAGPFPVDRRPEHGEFRGPGQRSHNGWSRMATDKQRRKRHRNKRPRCIVIAGPNGAGKTTFAREYLPGIARVVHFVNADLIAGGLSPLKPELAAIAAARMVFREIDRLASERADFAFETTLSGRTYVRRIEAWKRAGYRIEIVFLRLNSVDLALRRIETRVRQGGHDVPKRDVLRRFKRGWENFHKTYQPMAECWAVYDNSGLSPQLMERQE
jgi:predicted ABC-type ATPase